MPEIMMAGSLLLAMIVLVSAPIMLTTRAMQSGQAKLESQHQLREPIDRMLTDLRSSCALEISALSGGSNSVVMYDKSTKDGLQISYTFDSANKQIKKDVKKYSGGGFVAQTGFPLVFAKNITVLALQPMYEYESSPNVFAWTAYQLPLPDPSATGTLPPRSKEPPPANTLVTVRVVGQDSADATRLNAPALDVTTSFYTRN